MTTMTKDSPLAKAAAKAGLVRDGGEQHPFLDWKGKIGNFFIGEITDSRDLTIVVKKGRNKGKKQETTYFIVEAMESNIEGVVKGDVYTISPAGLLKYQLTTGAEKKGLKVPYRVGIEYSGKDEEGRHKTTVFFPSK